MKLGANCYLDLDTVFLVIEWVVKECEKGSNLEKIKVDFALNFLKEQEPIK